MKNKNLENLKQYKKILYVIDMVNGFVKEGVMHDEGIANIIDHQIELIEKWQKEKEAIAFIKDVHKEDAVEFNTFPKHCVIGTSEAELVDELLPYEAQTDLIYTKNSTSAMFANGLIETLDNMENLEEVVGVGCCTDICVLNFLIPLKNYFNQVNRDIDVVVVKNATETYDAPNHNREYFNKIAYELIKQAGIIVVDDIKQLEKEEKTFVLRRENR